jgi:hypothetical protein
VLENLSEEAAQAVLDALKPFQASSEAQPELPVPALTIVPTPVAPSPIILAEMTKQPQPTSAPPTKATPASSVVWGRPSVDLTVIAPPKEGRSEFNLPKFIDGTPKRLTQLSKQVLTKMPWLVEMVQDSEGFPKADGTTKAQEVRKCLEMTSDKTMGNPNHWALVQLVYLQKELHEQEEVKERALRLQANRNAPRPLERTVKAPANNGWGRTPETVSDEEKARREAQSAAALAAKKVTIGQPNRQGAVTARGDSVPGVGGGGSKKVRQGRKGAKKA